MRPHFITLFFNLRSLGLLTAYLLILAVSYWLAFELRFDFSVTENYEAVRVQTIWWVLLLKFSLLLSFGQMESVLSYFRLPDALRLLLALTLAAVILVLIWYQFNGKGLAPRSVILSDLQFSFLALVGFRLLFRLKASKDLGDWLNVHELERVIIVGAGEVGAGLCSELMSKRRLGMRPVAFLDDDRSKLGRYVHSIQVAGEVEDLPEVAKHYDATKVVVAFPSASVKRVKFVAQRAREAGLKVDIVPALTDLVSGRAELSQLRPIQLEDLLGRDPVDLDDADIRALLTGKRILITGAGGSIGAELVKQVAAQNPAALACLDQAELAVFNLKQDVLPYLITQAQIETHVLDICDKVQLERLFRDFRPEIIFHAAAHKHVILMEGQPVEAVRNNAYGTLQLARLAAEHGVGHFVFISTDKAINPTSVMGASKRVAELALIAQQATAAKGTRFMAVRFGNVLGSSGSVVPIFSKQIAEGGPVTVTDPEVTRFFMTIEEAVGLVLQSATMGKGGEIFVLDMGKSIKILDVAQQMIALAGMKEGEDIEIQFIGLRAGEKRFEEVQHLSEKLHETKHPRVHRFIADDSTKISLPELGRAIEEMLESNETSSVREAMQALIPEYEPSIEN